MDTGERCIVLPAIPAPRNGVPWLPQGEIDNATVRTYFMPDAWRVQAMSPDVVGLPSGPGLNVHLVPHVFKAAAWEHKEGGAFCFVGDRLEEACTHRPQEPPDRESILTTRWRQVGFPWWSENPLREAPVAEMAPAIAKLEFPDQHLHLVITWLLDWVEERRAAQEAMNDGALTIAGVTAFESVVRRDRLREYFARMVLHSFDLQAEKGERDGS